MNFNEELALAGELELSDSELETVNGGWSEPRRFDYDDRRPYYYPYYYYPYYYYPRPYWGWGGGDRDDRRRRDRD